MLNDPTYNMSNDLKHMKVVERHQHDHHEATIWSHAKIISHYFHVFAIIDSNFHQVKTLRNNHNNHDNHYANNQATILVRSRYK